jgi:hypothetical protein
MTGMSLRGWAAWMPGLETPSAWLAWARGGGGPSEAGQADAPPTPKEIPPLLRRRADAMGRAALHVMTRLELPYRGQPIILCSRLGELGRSFALQEELAREGRVSPQRFSMAVHHAIGGLFMMAKRSCAQVTALAAGGEEALAGLHEAAAQLADGAGAVWLLFCEEPLPDAYRSFAVSPDARADYFAFALELVPGDGFELAPGGRAACAASPLDLLAFLLRSTDDEIALSPRGGWIMRRNGRSEN